MPMGCWDHNVWSVISLSTRRQTLVPKIWRLEIFYLVLISAPMTTFPSDLQEGFTKFTEIYKHKFTEIYRLFCRVMKDFLYKLRFTEIYKTKFTDLQDIYKHRFTEFLREIYNSQHSASVCCGGDCDLKEERRWSQEKETT